MPNLLSRSKHVEFEWNLALQIINQKERWSIRRVEKEESSGVQNFRTTVQKFRTTMQKFRTGAKFRCEIFSSIFYFLVFFTLFSHFALHV